MTTPGIKTVIFPAKDLERTKAIFTALLGTAPDMDEPYYVSYTAADGQHVGLNPRGHEEGMAGPVGYWHVDDIDASLAALVAAGAEAGQPVTEVGPGRRIATVTDPDGNVIGLLQDS
jgi:predicted enzyme related to lactoylglutathione lyase